MFFSTHAHQSVRCYNVVDGDFWKFSSQDNRMRQLRDNVWRSIMTIEMWSLAILCISIEAVHFGGN